MFGAVRDRTLHGRLRAPVHHRPAVHEEGTNERSRAAFFKIFASPIIYLPSSFLLSYKINLSLQIYLILLIKSDMAQFLTRIGQLGLGLAVAGSVVNSALYNGMEWKS